MKTELEQEYQTYLKRKGEFLAKHEGKFVLIKGVEIVDIFSSHEDALKVGLKKFGNVPFLLSLTVLLSFPKFLIGNPRLNGSPIEAFGDDIK